MDEAWLKNFLSNVPREIKLEGETLVSMGEKAFKKYAKHPALKCHNVSISYGKMQRYIDNLASSLAHLGVSSGDRVALILPNLLQYPISVFAILKLGAVVVNINPLYTTEEIDYLLDNSGAKVAIVLDMMAGKLDSLANKKTLEHVIVTKLADLYPCVKRYFFGFAIKYIKRVNISYSYKAHNFRQMVKHEQSLPKIPTILDTDLAFIQYTGATTGRPKGAMLSHRNIVANVTQVYAWTQLQMPEGIEYHIVISALPLYHIFSLTANLFTFIFKGGEVVMIPNPRDTDETIGVLKSTPFTVFNGLDTLYNHLLSSEKFVSGSYPTYKYSIAGGMATRESVAQHWLEVTKVLPANSYGLTEASPAVTLNIFGDDFDGSVGYPLPSTELQIRDLESNKVLATGEIGTLFVRGPQVMSGYWQNDEQTQLVLKDGWLNTKDLAYIDGRGKLILAGRQSDMIIVSGFNVYPAEVEAALDGFSQIKESAVIGVPDEDSGEAVIAYIVLKGGQQIDEIEIRQKCKIKIAAYKVPKHIIIKSDLPKTLVGKIDKVSLLKEYTK